MIEGINLCKSYGDHIILDKFNFKINDGECVCFSGKSGTGKTTLLNMIGLLESYDQGELLIDGKLYGNNRDKRQFYREKVGFLFQNFALIDNKTVEDNLELIKKSYRTGYSVKEVLEIVGLEDKLESKVYTLSGGEQQRVALARLYLKQCDLILADEPTGSLDSENAQTVLKMLFDLNAKGKTLIIVTHDEDVKKRVGRIIDL